MAHFEGTIKEFVKFVGPYARLKVAFLAAKYKKEKGKCEDCGYVGVLDAAHIKGKERAIITANILSEYIDNSVIKIDLSEFEERFVEAHLPLEATIRVLCKECHRIYDRKEETALPEHQSTRKEIEMIEKIIADQMNKTKALKLCASKGINSLTYSNVIFSNVIPAQGGWWLQPSNDKFKNDLHIILNDDKLKKLFFFKLPFNTVSNPASYFNQRNDKYRPNCSNIYIPTDGYLFKEKNGFDFTPYLEETILYQ